VGGTTYTCSVKCPHGKKSNGVRSGDRGDHAVGPPRPIHLPGYVTSNNSRTFSPAVVGLLRAGTITPVAQRGSHLQAAPAEQSKNTISSSNPAGVVASKDNEDLSHDTSPYIYAIADLMSTCTGNMGLARNQSRLLWTLKTSLHVKHASSAQRIFS
jgi:hypothetical protein